MRSAVSGARAFTLVEALVGIAAVVVLIGVLLPGLTRARGAARAAACLSNIRQLEMAHAMYMDASGGMFIDADLPHGGGGDARKSWVVALEGYIGAPPVLRSPVDRSPAWHVSQGGTSTGPTLSEAWDLLSDDDPANDPDPRSISRWTSYGLNNLVVPSKAPPAAPGTPKHDRIQTVPRPHATVHFLMMAFEGPYARSDHTHVEGWAPVLGAPADVPRNAARQVEIGAHGGGRESWGAVSNYGFLDGHAATLRFGDVWESRERQKFWPPSAY